MVAEDDCAARSLVKDEVQDEDINDDIKMALDHGSDDERMSKEKAESESSDVDSEEGGSKPKPANRNEYLENKTKNMADLRKKLEEVKAQFPIPDDPISGGIVPKKAPKVPMSKKAPSDEPVLRRELIRNKVNRSVLDCDVCDDLLTSSLFSAPTTSASELTKATADSDAVEESPQPASPSATPNPSVAPAPPISAAKPLSVAQNTIVEALQADSDAVEESSQPASPSATQNPSVAPASPISATEPLAVVQNTIVEDNSAPVANDPEVGQSASSVIGGGDVVMQDATSSSSPPKLEARNDEDLPGWLAQMIVYLRGVSEEVAWQNLVTGFFDFEKCGPPAGVSSFSFVTVKPTEDVHRIYLLSFDHKRSLIGSGAKRRMSSLPSLAASTASVSGSGGR